MTSNLRFRYDPNWHPRRVTSKYIYIIQEKSTAMPDDLGRDVASVETLLRNHENFERDLDAIESQVRILEIVYWDQYT